jgi:hypothetical protein
MAGAGVRGATAAAGAAMVLSVADMLSVVSGSVVFWVFEMKITGKGE